MNYPQGSIWRKWDLHVHTPESIHHQYSANGEDLWEKFIVDLESLPPEFKVIGVNDYLFIDGYVRLLDEKKSGRLPNIDLLLPVVELRLDKFCGTKGHLSKINLHVIFSEEVPPDAIMGQFINALSPKFVLSPEHLGKIEWSGVPTRENITQLGENIIKTSPAEKHAELGKPFLLGFNNLTLPMERITEALGNPCFKNKYLTAVGKTEWAALEWNDSSIADKKNVINGSSLVFVAAESPLHWAQARKALESGCVNSRLLDCSDAHHFSDSKEKDRIGNCFTWVKSDTTFNGLRHAIKEFDSRVYVGKEPPKIRNVRSNKTKYISSLKIQRKPDSDPSERWFDAEIPLNCGLVAVIGRKGSGKSALTDTLGLLGSSRQEENFGFLNPGRFRDPKDNKARDYTAMILWEDGTPETKSLSDKVDVTSVERVKYIPQDFLEKICNPVDDGGENDFDRELKNVIFSHVPEADQLGRGSLDELLSAKTKEKGKELVLLQQELSEINQKICELEMKAAPEYRHRLEKEVEAKQNELTSYDGAKPTEVEPPPSASVQDPAIIALRREIEEAKEEQLKLEEVIRATEDLRKQQVGLLATGDEAILKIANFVRQYDDFVKALAPDLEALGIKLEEVVQLNLNDELVRERRKAAEQGRNVAAGQLDPENAEGLVHRSVEIARRIKNLQDSLDEPSRKYESYVSELAAWTEERQKIVGDRESPGTIEYYKSLLEDAGHIPVRLENLRKERTEKVKEIYKSKSELAGIYAELYRPVKEFIERNDIAEALQLDFQVSIVESGFTDGLLNKINQGVRGSFIGKEEGRDVVKGIREKYDFNIVERVIAFLDEVLDHLSHDKRVSGASREVRVEDQLLRGETVQGLYNYIFGLDYLAPRYTLRMGNKELSQLSPGEKGSLLLIFFLLVDKSDVPLIVDQPEENLDNETVFYSLVPCIKQAKLRRQIIIVTHNPNLAVVCDAEQVVHAKETRDGPQRISYTSGSIENPHINRRILDVLEGTRPAFKNRDSKYLPEKG